MTGVTTLKCKHVSEVAFEYLSGELPPDKASAVESHLAVCELCQAELKTVACILEGLTKSRTTCEPPDVLAEIRDRATQTQLRALNRQLVWIAGATLLLLIGGWTGIVMNLGWHRGDNTSIPMQLQRSANSNLLQSAEPKGDIDNHNGKILVKAIPKTDLPQQNVLKKVSTGRLANRSPNKMGSKGVQNGNRFRLESGNELVPSEPTVDYMVVYAPDAEAVANSPAVLAEVGEATSEALDRDASFYSIKMVDTESGEVTTLVVQKTVDADGESKISVDVDVTKPNEGISVE
jgi:hypothetical protein